MVTPTTHWEAQQLPSEPLKAKLLRAAERLIAKETEAAKAKADTAKEAKAA